MKLYFSFLLLVFLVAHPRATIGKPGSLKGSRKQPKICGRSTTLALAVRCKDSTELLYCPPSRLPSYEESPKRSSEDDAKSLSSSDDAESLSSSDDAESLSSSDDAESLSSSDDAKSLSTSDDAESLSSSDDAKSLSTSDDAESLSTSDDDGIDVCASGGIFEEWAAGETCQENGGFQEILPYYTGCYPKKVNFWASFAPELNINSSAEIKSKVFGYPLPPLNLANFDFEDSGIGLAEWTVSNNVAVRQKKDRRPRCEVFNSCLAHEGTGYASIEGLGTLLGSTPPNSLSRDDFRIPGVDKSVCKTDIKFCFTFAMRFISTETVQPPSASGRNDFFTVQIQVGGDGELLFDKTIDSIDVEGFGDNTMFARDDGGWEVVDIELPAVPLGEPTFFTLRALATNVGQLALSPIGLLDSLNIGPCVGNVVV